MDPSARPSNLTTWIVLILAVVIVAAIAIPGLLSSQRASNERGASATLKTIASAEADFRGNDRDKNGILDFWTEDVAGLYGLVPPGTTEPIQLITRGLAEADPAYPGAKPCAGYWFTAMDQDEDGQDYRQNTRGNGAAGPKNRNLSKFGFCAYPLDRGTDRSEFYLNEGNTIFKEDLKAKPRTRWPSDSELRVKNSKID